MWRAGSSDEKGRPAWRTASGAEDDDRPGVDVAREPACREVVDVAGEHERARPRDAETEVVDASLPACLGSDASLVEPVELEAHLDLDSRPRRELVAAPTDLERGRAGDAEPRRPRGHAEQVDRVAPRRRSTVQERHLRSVDGQRDPLVDPEAREGGEDVLHGAYPEPAALRLDGGRPRGRRDHELVDPGDDRPSFERHRPDPLAQRHADRGPRVQARAFDPRLAQRLVGSQRRAPPAPHAMMRKSENSPV